MRDSGTKAFMLLALRINLADMPQAIGRDGSQIAVTLEAKDFHGETSRFHNQGIEWLIEWVALSPGVVEDMVYALDGFCPGDIGTAAAGRYLSPWGGIPVDAAWIDG